MVDVNFNTSDTKTWHDIKKELPPVNVLVYVHLTNDCYAMDFVNEPVDYDTPFQHYLVKEWRYADRFELNNYMKMKG